MYWLKRISIILGLAMLLYFSTFYAMVYDTGILNNKNTAIVIKVEKEYKYQQYTKVYSEDKDVLTITTTYKKQ